MAVIFSSYRDAMAVALGCAHCGEQPLDVDLCDLDAGVAHEELDSINRDIGAEIGKLRRELAAKGISRDEFDRKLRYQLDKKKRAAEEARERLC